MERHVLAGINLAGILLDPMGGLYLAYDLLGGRKRPLRTITRCATYTVLFGLGYGLLWDSHLASWQGQDWGSPSVWSSSPPAQMGRVSGHFPIGRSPLVSFGGWRWGSPPGSRSIFALATRSDSFGDAFGLLSGLGLILIYMLRFAPSDEYQALAKPHLTSRKLLATMTRGGVIRVAGILAGTLTREGLRGAFFGLEVGLVVAAAGAIVATLSRFIECWADRLPERRLGIFGATLVFAGFALQSLQYWAALLNIPVR